MLPWLGTRVPTEWLPGAGGAGPPARGDHRVLAHRLRRGAASVSETSIATALAGGSAATFLVLAAFFLPAFRSAQPNATITEDVVRERRYRPDATVAYCSDAVRVQRDLLFAARVAAAERCDLWSLVASPQPFLLVLTAAEYGSLSRAPELRPIADYRGLPATALTLGGLAGGMAPETVVLAANFATDDPVAEVKRRKDRKRLLREDDPDLP